MNFSFRFVIWRRLALLAGCCAVAWASSQPIHAQDGPPSPSSVPPGFTVVEGDILVPVPGPHRYGGSFLSDIGMFDADFWPDGVVPYVFEDSVSADQQAILLSCMRELESVCNTRWRPRVLAWEDCVHFRAGSDNLSTIGRSHYVGEQYIVITSWTQRYRIIHEMIHTLGFYHEHSRGDRDTYLTLNRANYSGDDNQWDVNMGHHGGWWGPYNFDSIMHYSRCGFSVCGDNTPSNCPPGCEVIDVRPPWAAQWRDRIGQRDHFSEGDKQILSFIYTYSDWKFVDVGAPPLIGSGSFLAPFDQLDNAISGSTAGTTIWFKSQGGTYATSGTLSKPMTYKAAWEPVSLVRRRD